jgi:aspartate ammonia-lyase
VDHPQPRKFRLERDALGEVEVPVDALYGGHTVRGLDNFSVSRVTLRDRPDLIRALGQVKAAAAQANLVCGVLDARRAGAIIAAAREVQRSEHDADFPLNVVVGGGGTVINMNANEVIANRATELLGGTRGRYDIVHPNDHVNRSQSTNDVIPTALALATVAVSRRTLEALAVLEQALLTKAAEMGDLQRLGRTCLQDAVSLSVSDTHVAQAHAVARTAAALSDAVGGLLDVPLGATAVGTGVGAPAGYRPEVLQALREESGLSVGGAENLFDALANIDQYVTVAAQLMRVSIVMAKIAADLRLLTSGPGGGIAEVTLPAVQVGSSIMPGKINPVIPELVMQVSYETRATATVVEAAAAAGELELNVMEPVIARHLLGSLEDVGRTAQVFADRCIRGLQWNRDAVTAHLSGSLDTAVELAASVGYSKVHDGGEVLERPGDVPAVVVDVGRPAQ